MLTKRCCDCGQVKRVELFDSNRRSPDGHSAQCKHCRRQRQNRGGYGTARNRALAELARQHPAEYRRYRRQARRQLAPDTATATVWDQARGRALAELARRHRAEWRQHYRQVQAAHPDWSGVHASNAATALQRHAHHPEYLELLAGYAGARPAGPKLVAKILRRAQRLLQLAHPQEYQALYTAERAKLANPTQQQPAPPQAVQAGMSARHDHDRGGTDPTRRARTCDFCAAAPAAWRYPARGDRLATVRTGDALVIIPGGDWHACPACHLLVQAGQWEALSAKARLPHDQGAALWTTFRAARAGTPILLDPQAPSDHGQAEDERGRP
jgi:hypothetical protein